jgi:dynein heavy chain
MYVKLGDKDVEYNKNFKLFLHTKLSNPHYPPEIQAETTLINFTVTEQVRCCLNGTVRLVCILTLAH